MTRVSTLAVLADWIVCVGIGVDVSASSQQRKHEHGK